MGIYAHDSRRRQEVIPAGGESIWARLPAGFCTAAQSGGTQSGGNASTIGQEKLVNPVLTQDEDQYVAELLADLDAYPAYYAHMGPANAAGAGPADLSPSPRGRCAASRPHRRR